MISQTLQIQMEIVVILKFHQPMVSNVDVIASTHSALTSGNTNRVPNLTAIHLGDTQPVLIPFDLGLPGTKTMIHHNASTSQLVMSVAFAMGWLGPLTFRTP
jgi:hypothetical protein